MTDDIRTEYSVLAISMKYPGCAGTAVRILSNLWPVAFTADRLTVAEKIREYVQSNKHPDHGTLARELPESIDTINQAMRCIEDASVIDNRTETLVTIAKRRLLGDAADKCRNAADGDMDVEIALSSTFGRLADIYSGGVEMHDAPTLVDNMCARYERAKAHGNAITGIPTGLTQIDTALSGLKCSEMHVLAARTRHGKSALAVNYITPNALAAGYPVLVIGHEMTPDDYQLRMACALADVDYATASRGDLYLPTEQRLYEAVHAMRSWELTIIDAQCKDPTELMANVISWRHKVGKPGLVIVDHVQNETIPGWRGQRHEMYAHISAQWKSCMRVSGCAGLIIAHLNRGAAGQAPKIEHLRDSGAIEQDAYSVMLLYRPGVEDDDQPANQARVALPKNRNGSLAYEYLHFTGRSMRFRSWSAGDVTRTDAEMREHENNHHQDAGLELPEAEEF